MSRARIAVSLLLAAHLLAAVAVAASASPSGPRPTPVAPPAPVAAGPTTPASSTSSPAPKTSAPRAKSPERRGLSTPRVRRTAATTRPGPTAQQRLDAAIARIPGYRAGSTRWVLHAKDGYWGTADWYRNTIYISPKVPATRLYDVVLHEWAHLLTVRAYSNDPGLAMAETNRFFGGTGVGGAERAADCMARQLGARWTHYSPCSNPSWRAGAARLLAGAPA